MKRAPFTARKSCRNGTRVRHRARQSCTVSLSPFARRFADGFTRSEALSTSDQAPRQQLPSRSASCRRSTTPPHRSRSASMTFATVELANGSIRPETKGNFGLRCGSSPALTQNSTSGLPPARAVSPRHVMSEPHPPKRTSRPVAFAAEKAAKRAPWREAPRSTRGRATLERLERLERACPKG